MNQLINLNSSQITSFVEPSVGAFQNNYLDNGHCLFHFLNNGYCNSGLFSSVVYLDFGGALAAFGLIFTVYQLRNPIWDTVLNIRSIWQRYSFWAFGIIGLLLILSRVLVTQIPIGYLSYPFDVPILYEVLAYIFFAYNTENREVVLADRGVGVLATLKKALPNLINDKDALNEAFTSFISGRVTQQSRGNGLKYVKEVVQKSLISLRFQSGNAELEIKRDSSDLNIKQSVQYLRGCLAYIKY